MYANKPKMMPMKVIGPSFIYKDSITLKTVHSSLTGFGGRGLFCSHIKTTYFNREKK